MNLFRTTILAGAALALAGTAHAAENYRVSGGPAGGAWHPALTAGVQLLNEKNAGKYVFHYTPSNGSVENVRRIALGDTDTAWGHVVQIYQAWNGTGLFERDGEARDYRIIANVRKQTQIIAVLADSPIRSYSDMVGKRVNLLNRGSGSNVNCENIFRGIGILDDVDPRYLGFAESARALGDRQIDVYCSAGAPFMIPAITELSLTRPIRYISMTDEEQARVVGTNPFYVPITIPVQPDVRGMTEPAKTISYDVFWMVSPNVSDEAVYDMLTTVASPESLRQLAATAAYWNTLSGDFSSLEVLDIPVHPAAARFWREQGTEVAESIVQGF